MRSGGACKLHLSKQTYCFSAGLCSHPEYCSTAHIPCVMHKIIIIEYMDSAQTPLSSWLACEARWQLPASAQAANKVFLELSQNPHLKLLPAAILNSAMACQTCATGIDFRVTPYCRRGLTDLRHKKKRNMISLVAGCYEYLCASAFGVVIAQACEVVKGPTVFSALPRKCRVAGPSLRNIRPNK